MREYQLGLYEKAMPSHLTWPERLSEAKRADFDFVEISIDETDERLSRLGWRAQQRLELVRAGMDAGLSVRTMCLSGHRKYPLGSRDEAVRARGMQILRDAVHLAGDIGVRIIQLAGYDVYYEQGGDDTRAWFRENLLRSVEYAAQYSVTLGFETMETPFMDTISKGMAYVNEIASPYLGMYPDLGNLTNGARLYGLSVPKEIAAGRGHMFAMHLKETEPGVYRDMRFGTGQVDFASGIRSAIDAGVRMFTAECWHDGGDDWREVLRAISRLLRNHLAGR